MQLHTLSLLTSISGLCGIVLASGIDPFPIPYSSSFLEPVPPQIPVEFTANFMQHKYDATGINHPTAGFGYWSPSNHKLRVDAADSGSLTSSLFDFGNMSADGLVSNRKLTFNGGVKQTQASCFSDFVAPAFVLFSPDMLNATQAVFIGTQLDSLYGPLNAWQLLFSAAPADLVTVYLDANNTLVRYDFSAPGQAARTFATTRFFNIVLGPVDPSVFETDCN